jgi:hypothetical protein
MKNAALEERKPQSAKSVIGKLCTSDQIKASIIPFILLPGESFKRKGKKDLKVWK